MPLAALPPIIANNPAASVAAVIVFLGLLIYGFKDLVHFSFGRAWAISGVCFRESVRRRVLWIIPLTIVGVIVVAQLQHPTDEQDAIRQSTKFCLFATGLVVTITAIILACTNLPKEIESRVIYTIVTKPITRLEIVLGKVIGFVRISATILIIMGVFTLAYMQVRAWSLRSSINQRLKEGTVDAATNATLVHYRDAGLLNSRTYGSPGGFQIFSREPKPNDSLRWMYGADGNFVLPFRVSREDLIPKNDPTQTPGSGGVYIVARVGFDAADLPAIQPGPAKPVQSGLPDVISAPTPAPASKPTGPNTVMPTVTFDVLDQNQNSLLDSHLINGGKPVSLTDPAGQVTLQAYIPAQQADTLLKTEVIYIRCRGNDAKMEFSAGKNAIALAVPLLDADPAAQPSLSSNATVIEPAADSADPTAGAMPSFSTNSSTYGVQLRGGDEHAPVAIYSFRNVFPKPDAQGNVPLELRVGIERNGDENGDHPTEARVSVVDRDQKNDPATSARYTTTVDPEINRTAFFTVPASSVASGNFDVIVQCANAGEYLGIQQTSLNLVVAEHSFVTNLVKSLLVLWLLSVLVVIVAIFCSTFLSWPIAVVLTVLILLGRWAVVELGDATAPGIGNMVATDMGLRDPSKMRVVSDSVEALAKLLNVLAAVLPDISKFSALDDIERGVSLPLSRLTDAFSVIAIFGVPLIVVSYVFLRKKEVAP